MPTRTRRLLDSFAERISADQPKPTRKFIAQALRAIYVAEDSMISAWARTLREKNFRATEKRLSNALRSRQWDDAQLRDRVLKMMGSLAKRKCSAIIIDSTDICKPYGRRMPFIGRVYDGSTGEIGHGWIALRADALGRHGRHVPVHIRTFSRSAPEFVSDHDELTSLIKSVLQTVPATMPFVFDSGHDGNSYRKIFNDLGIRFTVRMKIGGTNGLRKIPIEGHPTLVDLISKIKTRVHFRISTFTKRAKKSWRAEVGWNQGIRLSDPKGDAEKERYSVVVIRGYRDPSAPPMEPGPGCKPVPVSWPTATLQPNTVSAWPRPLPCSPPSPPPQISRERPPAAGRARPPHRGRCL